MGAEKPSAMSLTEAIKGLQGVKLMLCRKHIDGWLSHSAYYDGKRTIRHTIELEGISLTVNDLLEMHDDTLNEWSKIMISPVGVQTLIRLYELGHLPCSKGGLSKFDEHLAIYAARNERIFDLKKQRDTFLQHKLEAARAELSKPLDDFVESELTYEFLNRIFWHRGLKGNASLTIGGINVSKTLTRYKSNSGKTQDYEVTFSWLGADGQQRSVNSESYYKDNRRNDSERDWGFLTRYPLARKG